MPAKPTTAFDATKVARFYKCSSVFTPTGGSAVTFVGKLVDLDGKTVVIDRKVPDVAGLLRPDIHFATEGTEDVILKDVEEIDTVLAAIGGLTGMVRGAVQHFLHDSRDSATTIRLMSESYSCAVMRDGVISGDNAISKNPALKFMSEKVGPVTWTPNATVT